MLPAHRERVAIIKTAAAMRMAKLAVQEGVPFDIAFKHASDEVEKSIGNSVEVAFSTPDSAILLMTEQYLSHVSKVTRGTFDIDSPPGGTSFAEISRAAIREIETKRSPLGRLPGTPSDYFPDFVYQRLRLEGPEAFGHTPDEIGLDRKTVHLTVKNYIVTLSDAWSKQTQSNSSSCFVATCCFGTPDHEIVRVLRAYRDRRLRKTLLGRRFINWYYKRGPRLADFVSSHPAVRLGVRQVLRALAALIRLSLEAQAQRRT